MLVCCCCFADDIGTAISFIAKNSNIHNDFKCVKQSIYNNSQGLCLTGRRLVEVACQPAETYQRAATERRCRTVYSLLDYCRIVAV